MATAPLLKVTGLRKEFPVKQNSLIPDRTKRTVKAVDGISFDLEAGETLALVGESGCGKTTTCKLILRLIQPTDGTVELGSEDVFSLRGERYRRYRSRVQAVFQDPWSSLNPRARVRDIVAEPLVVNRLYKKSEVKDRVFGALEAVGLQSWHGDRYPHEFSGGQRQRIAIASALVSEPELIVLDEPVSSLDVSIRAQIMNLFQDIRREYKMSYLLIAHDLATTRFMSDRIAVMYLGKIVEYAETETLFSNPLHPYTQALFSAALPAHTSSAQENEIILSGEVPSPVSPPSGCPFHTRCHRFLGQECVRNEPILREVEDRHWVSCHLHKA